jgi:hypothetical protein
MRILKIQGSCFHDGVTGVIARKRVDNFGGKKGSPTNWPDFQNNEGEKIRSGLRKKINTG